MCTPVATDLKLMPACPGMFMHFKKPVMIVDGKMQYLFDETGRRYLDVCPATPLTVPDF